MKKALSMVLLLSMLAGMFSVGIAAQGYVVDDSYTLGDVNGDGESNAADALEVAKYLAGAEVEQFVRSAGDMNADGQVSAYDALQFRLCLAQAKDWSDYEITDGYGQAMYNFTIAGKPVTEETFCIVVPADTDPNTSNLYYGADQLRKHIRIATNENLTICFGEEEKTTENAIVFHQEDETGELGIEGFIYEVKDGQLNIYGTRRGNMYAVYDILEEYLGIRFYSGESTLLYKNRISDVPEGTYVERIPTLEMRMVSQSFDLNTAEAYFFPRKLNSSTLWGYTDSRHGTLTGVHFSFAHSFGYQWQMYSGPTAPEGTENPLTYRFENGDTSRNGLTWNPCFTDDEMYEHLFEGLVLLCRMLFEEWDNHFDKDTSTMSFSANDTDGLLDTFCKCADCSAIYATDGVAGASVYIANRAAIDIQEYYPGMRIECGAYDHTIPQNIFPNENIIFFFWGNGCNNHFLGSGACGDNVSYLGRNNTYDEKALKAWGDICEQTGAQLWFYYHPVTYHYFLTPCPNILNVYYDFRYLVNDCNVDGIFYEGGGAMYNFEELKAYLASRILYDPDMTEEEFLGHMKEYLYMQYGDGYEELYQFILMQNEAGDRAGCFNNNYDRPRQMYDYVYIDEHYEEMRALLVTALEKANTDAQRERIETLIVCCDFLGLTCVHYRYYKNGTEETKELYMERYDNMYNYIVGHDMDIYSDTSDNAAYKIPERISYEEDPMYQFYGAERPGISRYP